MSLNLPQVLSQMQDMGRTAASRVEQLAVKLPEAVETFRRVSLMKPKHIQARIAHAGNRWPGAVPTQEPLDLLVSPPTLPDQLKVIGADGSQIYPDRHAPAFYFMINIGSIIIAHGSGKQPQTNSRPWIYYQDEDLYDQNDGAITNAVVDGRRDVAEMGELARLADGCLGEQYLPCSITVYYCGWRSKCKSQNVELWIASCAHTLITSTVYTKLVPPWPAS